MNKDPNIFTAQFGTDASTRLEERKPNELCKKMGIKRDMVNYKPLEGHKYEIKENPDRKSSKNSRIYVCKYDDCNKEFSKTWNLVYHFRVHTKEKPHKCSLCPKSFTQYSNLKKHFIVHTSPNKKAGKGFKCDFCQKNYSSVYYLRTHQKKCMTKFGLPTKA